MGHPATWEGGLSPTLESVRAHTVRRWCGVPPWRPRAAGGRAGGRGRATAAPRQLAGGSGGSGSSRVGHGGSGGATGRPLQLRRLSGGARGRASWRSCTFFLQTAISKRRDHADLPGKPGPGNRMNVQQRPSCTFILSPDAPQGEKTLEPRHRPHQDPRMNVQHGPTPPAGTTTSRPVATTPAPTRPARYLNPEANTCAPTPTGRHNQQIPRQGSRPRRPTSDPTPTNRPLALITPQEAAS